MIRRPTLSQTTVDKMFPVSHDDFDKWWNEGLTERWKDIVCRCACRYQADIEHAAQQADHHEVRDLVKRVRVFYRRCKVGNEKIEKLFNLTTEQVVLTIARIGQELPSGPQMFHRV